MYLAAALVGTGLVWLPVIPDVPDSTWPLWLATGGFWALAALGIALERFRAYGRKAKSSR